jgi:hypothetical protein
MHDNMKVKLLKIVECTYIHTYIHDDDDDDDDAEGAIKGVIRPGLKLTTLLRLVARYRVCGAVPSFAHTLSRHGLAYVQM